MWNYMWNSISTRFTGQKNRERNVFVLSENECGKACFFQYYLDKVYDPAGAGLFKSQKLVSEKTVADSKQTTRINFIFNRSGNDDSPSFAQHKQEYDVILIMVDLNESDFMEKIKNHQAYVQMHYPNVKTLLVGTKSDCYTRTEKPLPEGLIASSALAGTGFDDFEAALMAGLELNDRCEQISESSPQQKF